MRDLSRLQRVKPLRQQRGFLQFLPLITGGLSLLGSRNQPDRQTTSQGGTSYGTSTTQLPQELVGQARFNLDQSRNLYNNQFQQGVPVAGLSPLFNQAYQTAGQAVGGQLSNPYAQSGGNQFAQGGGNRFATGNANQAPTTSIFASGQGINPYLNQVYDTAANATQNRLASEFARAGRGGSPANQQARSQELQTLAASIFAPGFEAERQRQYGASEAGIDRGLSQTEANLARQYGATEANLARQYGATEANLGRQFAGTEANLARQMSSIPLAASLGQLEQAQRQRVMDAPEEALRRNIDRTNALAPLFPGTSIQQTDQTGQVTQPLYNNPMSSFLGGAMLGQQLQPMMGSIFSGPGTNPTGSVGFNPWTNPTGSVGSNPGYGGLGYFDTSMLQRL